MLSAFLTVLLAQSPGPEVAAEPETHRQVSWAEFCERHFDPQWALPAPSSKESENVPQDLVAWFEGLAARDLRFAADQQDKAAAEGAIRLGDLIAELAPLRRSTKQVLDSLEKKAAELPGLDEDLRTLVAELVCDVGVHEEKWKPSKNLKDDGIVHLPSWELSKKTKRGAPWDDRKGDSTVLRAAVLVFADLESWFSAENDCSIYLNRKGSRLESVSIPPESRVQTQDAHGARWLSQIFRMDSDLPFPFGGYQADNRVRLGLRPDGLVMNEVYVEPGKDFKWLSGRDVFLPLSTSDGEFVALLVIQEFGFDLDGVPEGDSNRKEGVRDALGNKKRHAERRFQPKERLPDQRGRLPKLR